MSECKLSEVLKLCDKDCKVILKYYNSKVKIQEYKNGKIVNEKIGGDIIEPKLAKDWIESIDKNELRDYMVEKIIPSEGEMLYIETEKSISDFMKKTENRPSDYNIFNNISDAIRADFEKCMEESRKEVARKMFITNNLN